MYRGEIPDYQTLAMYAPDFNREELRPSAEFNSAERILIRLIETVDEAFWPSHHHEVTMDIYDAIFDVLGDMLAAKFQPGDDEFNVTEDPREMAEEFLKTPPLHRQQARRLRARAAKSGAV